MRSFSLLSLLLLISFAVTNGSKCYVCKSEGDIGKCRDPFNPEVAASEAKVCLSGWCGKLIGGNRVGHEGHDHPINIERLCLEKAPSNGRAGCSEAKLHFNQMQTCLCRGDLCNHSNSMKLSFFTLFGTLVLLFRLYYFE